MIIVLRMWALTVSSFCFIQGCCLIGLPSKWDLGCCRYYSGECAFSCYVCPLWFLIQPFVTQYQDFVSALSCTSLQNSWTGPNPRFFILSMWSLLEGKKNSLSAEIPNLLCWWWKPQISFWCSVWIRPNICIESVAWDIIPFCISPPHYVFVNLSPYELCSSVLSVNHLFCTVLYWVFSHSRCCAGSSVTRSASANC